MAPKKKAPSAKVAPKKRNMGARIPTDKPKGSKVPGSLVNGLFDHNKNPKGFRGLGFGKRYA